MNCQDALNAVMWQENKIVLLIGELEDDLLTFVEDQFGPITKRSVGKLFSDSLPEIPSAGTFDTVTLLSHPSKPQPVIVPNRQLWLTLDVRALTNKTKFVADIVIKVQKGSGGFAWSVTRPSNQSPTAMDH
ncbi:hypothetical protein MOC16_gp232 [Klebsiella phage vB_KpM_FBKp24]|uniref:Uncharacterized protein n=1 Tax=Klebsiella phage vB_KpM_FBKp24 TaxID=2801834 RepID=A0A7U0GBR0_9CAUD|nr:hypothetical protein MOC16_gp232 [Klebsiella phage vB_KpM_FBKp24]QQV92243.1 hypothetical protein vBKpMFBKp24_181 [Klebsiella phage vB_KpM_FBKp24]